MISTHWRASIRLPDGREFKAWVKQVSQRKVVIRNEFPLREGSECGLTIYVPQAGATETGIVHVRCRAGKSVMAAMEFSTWLDFLELKDGAQWMQD